MANEKTRRSTCPPSDLPADPARFWSSHPDPAEIGPPPSPETPPALQQLGTFPFPSGGFPLMGFLATVYEHVSTHARKAARGGGSRTRGPTGPGSPRRE